METSTACRSPAARQMVLDTPKHVTPQQCDYTDFSTVQYVSAASSTSPSGAVNRCIYLGVKSSTCADLEQDHGEHDAPCMHMVEVIAARSSGITLAHAGEGRFTGKTSQHHHSWHKLRIRLVIAECTPAMGTYQVHLTDPSRLQP